MPRHRRRDTITNAALQLIRAQGYESMSVNALAEAAGLSVGGLYRHIARKSDVLVMVCEDIYGGLRDHLADVASDHDDPLDALAAAAKAYLESCRTNRAHILLMYREYRHLPGDAKQRFQEREKAIAAVFADLIRAGIKRRVVRKVDPAVVAFEIVLLGHLPALKSWAVGTSAALDDEQVRFIVAALRTSPD